MASHEQQRRGWRPSSREARLDFLRGNFGRWSNDDKAFVLMLLDERPRRGKADLVLAAITGGVLLAGVLAIAAYAWRFPAGWWQW